MSREGCKVDIDPRTLNHGDKMDLLTTKSTSLTHIYLLFQNSLCKHYNIILHDYIYIYDRGAGHNLRSGDGYNMCSIAIVGYKVE